MVVLDAKNVGLQSLLDYSVPWAEVRITTIYYYNTVTEWC